MMTNLKYMNAKDNLGPYEQRIKESARKIKQKLFRYRLHSILTVKHLINKRLNNKSIQIQRLIFMQNYINFI